jgi:valyl-tRNA synthetase
MKASWPATGCDVDAAALDQYEALKQLVRGVRNARLEYGLEQARKVSAGSVCFQVSLRFVLLG